MNNDLSGFDGFDDTGFNSDGFEPTGFDLSDSGSDDWELGDSTGNNNLGLSAGSGFDDFGDNSEDQGHFSGAFDDSDSQSNYTDTPDAGTASVKKQSIIFIIIGVVAIIAVISIASLIKSNSSKIKKNSIDSEVVTQEDGYVQKDEVQSSNTKSNAVSTNNSSTVNSENQWINITSNENIQINKNYSDMVFTVTGIEHLAKTTDTKGNLVVKTKLLGSVSGLTGMYELDVPYNKGSQLTVGDSFTVEVLLGTFKDKTVVVDINYR